MCGKKSLYDRFLLLWLLCGLWCVVAAAYDWRISCPKGCSCEEKSNHMKTVLCIKNSLTAVPIGLSSEVQAIELFNNPIPTLPANTFKQAGLTNLNALKMVGCKINKLDGQAFSGLRLLKRIRLSSNKIRTIHPNTFQETTSLETVSMHTNPIEVLEDGLFTNLTFLYRVDFSYCEIKQIGLKTFDGVPNLSEIYLIKNRLVHIDFSIIKSLSLNVNLEISKNPWNCNCRLKDVRNWHVFRYRDIFMPECEQPRYLHGNLWKEIEPSQFKCTPYVLYLPGNETVTAVSENATLSCTALGDHLPEMYWMTPSGEKLTSDVKSNKYSIQESKTAENSQLVLNLTIVNIQTDDAGAYTCVADNSKGEDEHYAYYTQKKLRHTESSNTVIFKSKKPKKHRTKPV